MMTGHAALPGLILSPRGFTAAFTVTPMVIDRGDEVARPLLPAPLPPHVAPSTELRAIDDQAVLPALTAMRRRARQPIVVATTSVAALVLTSLAASLLEASDGLRNAIGVVAFVSGFGLAAVVLSHPLRRRTFKRAVRALTDGPWVLVEVVLMKGAPVDSGVPVLMILNPSTGEPVGSWLVDQFGRRGWPARDQREWAYLAVDSNGEAAVLAPPTRDRLTVLKSRTRVGTSAALHEWVWTTARARWVFPASNDPMTRTLPLGPYSLGSVHRPGDRSHWPNRPLTTRERLTILAVLVLVSTGLTALTLREDRGDTAHDRELLDEGSRSNAEVRSVYRAPRGDFAQLTIFIVDGDATGWEVRISVEKSTPIEEGDRIEVAYDPGDPGDLAVVGEQRAPNNGAAVFAWIATGLVTVRFGWRAWRQRRAARRASDPAP